GVTGAAITSYAAVVAKETAVDLRRISRVSGFSAPPGSESGGILRGHGPRRGPHGAGAPRGGRRREAHEDGPRDGRAPRRGAAQRHREQHRRAEQRRHERRRRVEQRRPGRAGAGARRAAGAAAAVRRGALVFCAAAALRAARRARAGRAVGRRRAALGRLPSTAERRLWPHPGGVHGVPALRSARALPRRQPVQVRARPARARALERALYAADVPGSAACGGHAALRLRAAAAAAVADAADGGHAGHGARAVRVVPAAAQPSRLGDDAEAAADLCPVPPLFYQGSVQIWRHLQVRPRRPGARLLEHARRQAPRVAERHLVPNDYKLHQNGRVVAPLQEPKLTPQRARPNAAAAVHAAARAHGRRTTRAGRARADDAATAAAIVPPSARGTCAHHAPGASL
ncbi:hypothetical protein M885DRAFT_616032, partial [Pelagophyceae sp. CCMP2097]